MVLRPTTRAATELVTWQGHLAERNPRAISTQVTAVEQCRALITAHRQSTGHRYIGSANLAHRVDGTRRGSAGPVYSVASHLKVGGTPLSVVTGRVEDVLATTSTTAAHGCCGGQQFERREAGFEGRRR